MPKQVADAWVQKRLEEGEAQGTIPEEELTKAKAALAEGRTAVDDAMQSVAWCGQLLKAAKLINMTAEPRVPERGSPAAVVAARR